MRGRCSLAFLREDGDVPRALHLRGLGGGARAGEYLACDRIIRRRSGPSSSSGWSCRGAISRIDISSSMITTAFYREGGLIGAIAASGLTVLKTPDRAP